MVYIFSKAKTLNHYFDFPPPQPLPPRWLRCWPSPARPASRPSCPHSSSVCPPPKPWVKPWFYLSVHHSFVHLFCFHYCIYIHSTKSHLLSLTSPLSLGLITSKVRFLPSLFDSEFLLRVFRKKKLELQFSCFLIFP